MCVSGGGGGGPLESLGASKLVFYAQSTSVVISGRRRFGRTTAFSTVSMFVCGGWRKADYSKLQDPNRKKISGTCFCA